jgi:hypothetical protein
MKFAPNSLVASVVLSALAGSASAQSLVQGPVFNAATGSRYYLVQAANWQLAQSFAASMGASLATCETLAESEWIRTTFSANDTRKLFIGLWSPTPNDAASYRWTSGSTAAYRNWGTNEPERRGGYTLIQGDGTWASRGNTFSSFAVIECTGPLRVPGEFLTIEDAFSAMPVANNFEVAVGPGTYTLGSEITGSVLDGREGRIIGAGAGQTTIVRNDGDALDLTGSWRIEGVNFRRDGYGQLLTLRDGISTIRDCAFDATGTTGGMIDTFSKAQVRLERSRFTNCPLIVGTGSDGTILMQNCLVIDSGTVANGGGSMFANNCTFVRVGRATLEIFQANRNLITNSILREPRGALTNDNLVIQYSNVQNGYPGPGNISSDPRFAGVNDYRLRADSPCVDAGDSDNNVLMSTDLGGNPRVRDAARADTGRGILPVDMGAYEFQPDAEPNCDADFNQDGFVDFFDFNDFVNAYEGNC